MTDVIAGRCSCGRRIVRGDIQGVTITAEPYAIDAATELREWIAGRPTYYLSYRSNRLVLEPRTTDDMRRKPVGFRQDRIVPTHECREVTL